ncbi:MAG: 50S ribosomal protein L28 [Bdellovibrionota bacterium]
MAQVCELTGKRPAYGNKVSHSNIKTRTRWMPNLRSKKYEIPELKQTISLLLSSRAIRTIDKLGGITPAIFAMKEALLSEQLQSVRRKIHKSRVRATAAGQTVEGKAAAATAKVAKAAKAATAATAKVAKAAKAAAPKAAKVKPAAKAKAAPKKKDTK